jgi:hypothetical protein
MIEAVFVMTTNLLWTGAALYGLWLGAHEIGESRRKLTRAPARDRRETRLLRAMARMAVARFLSMLFASPVGFIVTGIDLYEWLTLGVPPSVDADSVIKRVLLIGTILSIVAGMRIQRRARDIWRD